MQNYHYVWLEAHPERTEEWLADKLKDGFDIHHLDLDHANNDPKNLVLMEHRDHFMVHSGERPIPRGQGKRKKKTIDWTSYEKHGVVYQESLGRLIYEIVAKTCAPLHTAANYAQGEYWMAERYAEESQLPWPVPYPEWRFREDGTLRPRGAYIIAVREMIAAHDFG